jgi:hypothetical protein
MQANQIPNYFVMPFGKNAGAGFIHQVPTFSEIGIINGAASLNDGFVPLNFQPVEAGGVPPFGQDFNGLLFQTTAGVQWLQAGGLAVYSTSFAVAINGYPNGAVLVKANGTGFWISTVDNNFSNPDGATPTGWADLLGLYVKADGRTYGINISGNAATATNAANATNAQNAVNATNATNANTANSATSAGSANTSTTQPVGTSNSSIATTFYVNQEAFGFGGQTWQNMAGSRSLGIAYTNSTGRPILVSVTTTNSGPGNGGAIKAFVGAVNVAYAADYNLNYPNWVFFLVPPGSTYNVNNTGGTGQAINVWAECR